MRFELRYTHFDSLENRDPECPEFAQFDCDTIEEAKQRALELWKELKAYRAGWTYGFDKWDPVYPKRPELVQLVDVEFPKKTL